MTAPTRPVVVVADCYPLHAKALLQLVSRSFHAVEAAQCVDTLSIALRNHQPDVAVVGVCFQEELNILDVLPDLQAISPRTRFVLTTGRPDWAPAGRAFALGARGIVERTIQSDELTRVIEVVHAGGAYFMDHPVIRTAARVLPLAQPLSETQAKVFNGLRRELTYREIGAQLDITESTVGKHVHVIREKLGIVTEGAYVRWEHIVCPTIDGIVG